jgi:hypothetical protein
MLSATANAAKSAQICPILPNSAQRQKFEIPPKIEILVFLKKKNYACRRGSRACFHHFGFLIQKDFVCYFYCQKMALYVNFSIPACGN